MVIHSSADNTLIAKNRQLVQNAAANLRDLGEKHPLQADMIFRYTVLPSSGPQYMCRFEQSGWLTLKYFTKHNQVDIEINPGSGEYDSFDFSSIPAELFEPATDNPAGPVYASIRLPVKNHIAVIENFLRFETDTQKPTDAADQPGTAHHFLEMGTSKKYFGVSPEEKPPEIVSFLEDFIAQHLWFLDAVFKEMR